MAFANLAYFSAVLFGVLLSVHCYDVELEIAELKKMYGEHVIDKPRLECCQTLTDKRVFFGPYCHEKLGCFPTDGDFSERLVNLNPNSRETINTKFRLFTRTNPKVEQIISADSPSSITRSLFDAKRRTLFVIHGFLESTQVTWFSQMNAELLKNGDYNVINVDWGGFFASKTLYTQATANTRVVAAEIVYLLKTLKAKKSLDYSDVHIIGHSLGAHIAGYVGANLTGQIGRISGMDPAEPYFKGYSANIRLDASDAQFVDVLHSDGDSFAEIVTGGGGLGTSEVSGHADFFPNGGEDQPNCKNGIITNINLENELYEGLKRIVACDHNRAIQLYTQSVNNCPFTSQRCTDYGAFLTGVCSIGCSTPDQCNNMGFTAKKPISSQKYYVQTTGEGNYCTQSYMVQVTLDKDSTDAKGTIDLVLYGANKKQQIVSLSKDSVEIDAGKSHIFHAAVSTTINKVMGLEATWNRDVAWWRIVTRVCGWVGFCGHEIKIHEIKLTDTAGQVSHYCGLGRDFSSGDKLPLFYSASGC